MSEVSHHRGDLAGHPDVSEMRVRHERILGGREVSLIEAPVFLVGLYCAVSPWVVHFTGSQPPLVAHNLVVGAALALLALGFTIAPERMGGLSWAMSAVGVWMVLSAWIVGTSPDAGVLWNNIVIGGVAFCLGIACAVAARRGSRPAAGGTTD
ncbi:SPW repeat protein [Streptomyces sp. HNM0574]|uniref:SPW repeat protein n=1 Tax=Streptomyces sp. HNM0574 TaxID=2714954 RepID=UPI00146F534D|nr:SPW repeat protein [Streptomyces sp. HNM0574]NLU66152.1 SPW repeat protein [Streptomyces sp. HNM0574]